MNLFRPKLCILFFAVVGAVFPFCLKSAPTNVQMQRALQSSDNYLHDYIGSYGGSISGIASSGNLILAAQKDTIRIFDITKPRGARHIDSVLFDGMIDKLLTLNSVLYVSTYGYSVGEGEVLMMDVGTTTVLQPAQIIERNLLRPRIHIIENCLIIESSNKEPINYNITNPKQVRKMDYAPTARAASELSNKVNAELLDHISADLFCGLNAAIDIKILGEKAFVLDRNSQLHMLSLTDRFHPKHISSAALSSQASRIFVNSRYCFAYNEDSGLVNVFGFSSEDSLVCVDQLSTSIPISNLTSIENNIFVSTGMEGVPPRDLADNSNGFRVYVYAGMGKLLEKMTLLKGVWCNDFVAIDGYGFVVTGDICSLDLAQGSILGKYNALGEPLPDGSYDTYIEKGVVLENALIGFGFIKGEPYICSINISDPQNLMEYSRIPLRYEFQYKELVSSKLYACLLRHGNSTRGDEFFIDIIDASNISDLKYYQGKLSKLQSPGGIACSGDMIYVADDGGIAIFRYDH